MSSPPIPPTWPKPYLLEVYRRAVEEGCVRIPLPTQKHAQSFSQALYRLRRRSDAQHASFILPEYHLVTCAWEPKRQTVLVTYNKLPDGNELPEIQSVENAGDSAPEPLRRDQIVIPVGTEEEFDPEKFLADLVDEAGSKLADDEE